MAERTRMFSEHWYRVANQHVALRHSVRTRRQRFRGETWRVLYDPFAHRFFRLRPAAYEFVARLHPERTVEEVWKECLERDPDDAPGQDEVIRLLAQLYQANLLQLDLPPDAERFFERYRKRTQKERTAYITHIMFARFPLIDPDKVLNVLQPYIRALFSRAGLIVWSIVMFLALKVGIENFDALWDQTQGVLAPGNLFLLYVGLVLIKGLHEFGHAFAVKRFGGEVHTMGIMLLIFTPIPYIDATASWAFRQRRQRMLVAGSGMLVELFVAALAMFVWANTGPGPLNALSYNMMFIASVSTILFNGNPLLRYDGYYLLADALDIPNMFERGKQQLRYLTEGKLLGRRGVRPGSDKRNEAITLAIYGVLSGMYRVFVFSAIILFVSQRFLLLGIIMAGICITSWIIVPTVKFIHYLISDPALDRNRGRAIGISASAGAVVALLVAVIPFPSSFSSPGLLQAAVFTEVPARSGGHLKVVEPISGELVGEEVVLLQLDDPQWNFEWAAEMAGRAYAEALYRRALQEATADLGPIQEHLHLMDKRLARLNERREQMTLTAPMAGVWVAAAREDLKGLWVDRGIVTGYVLQPGRYVFRAIVSQDEAHWLFEEAGLRRARVRLRGSAGQPLEAESWRVIPAEQRRLPSPALGWFGGGEVAVLHQGGDGVDAAQTFFEVRAEVTASDRIKMYHGRTGRIRFRVEAETLWEQGYRRLRQLIQRRS